MAVVYLGIGSNLGNRQKNIDDAIALLDKNDIVVLKRSRIMETDALGGPPGQNRFFNAVVKAQTPLDPETLLLKLQSIERQLGRIKTVSNGPRTIDLDILLYDRLAVNAVHLTIPHPRMHGRNFVMLPLKEIDPELAEELSHARH